MPLEKLATQEELAKAEKAAEKTFSVWVNAFIQFPTAHNRRMLIEQLDVYQAAWMNGRKR